MATLKEIMQNDMLAIQADLENPVFIYDSMEFPCHVGGPEQSFDLDTGGFTEQMDLVLVVRFDDFEGGGDPDEIQKITFRNKIYRVENVVRNPNEAFFKMQCYSANVGA